MLIDSHAHLDFPEFRGDIDLVLQRAHDAGVGKIINIGADLELSREAVRLAEKYENVWATVGVHAEYADDHQLEGLAEKIKNIALSSKKVVAIGECGPDYNWNSRNREKQLGFFKIQTDLAKELNLPLVCHIRNGEDETAAADAYEALAGAALKKVIVHCFTLEKAWVKKFIDLGCYIGFTGIITYKNAENVRQSLKKVPLDKLLVETDAPYLAPKTKRGQRNEPAYIVEVAEKVAEIRKISIDEVERQTTENAEKVFNII